MSNPKMQLYDPSESNKPESVPNGSDGANSTANSPAPPSSQPPSPWWQTSLFGLSLPGSQVSKEFASTYDYCMVFDLPETGNLKKQSDIMKHCVTNMLRSGLELYPYTSVQDDEVLVLIRCPLDILKAFTDKVDFKLLADPQVLEDTLTTGDLESKINPIEINGDPLINPSFTPYENIFITYDDKINPLLYNTPHDGDSPFTKIVRLKLLYYLIRAPIMNGGCDIELNRLLFKKKIKSFYPLHDNTVAVPLLTKIMDKNAMPWDIPADELKQYFGEKIALFHVFIAHYSMWLIVPAIFGVICQIWVIADMDSDMVPNFSAPILPFFAIFIACWAISMLEFWKRSEGFTALRWGMTDYEQSEPDRPEYIGDPITSPVTGKIVTFSNPTEMAMKVSLSRAVVLSFIALVVGIVTGIYIMRMSVQSSIGFTSASILASVLNTVQITVFNLAYQYIAIWLTDNENHRTDTMYEDSLITKLFVFQFINSYSSFFFLAFVAQHLPTPNDTPSEYIGECGARTCMQPLALNLAIILGLRLTLNNVIEFLVPFISYQKKKKEETDGIDPRIELSEPEEDYILMQYNSTLENIKNYADTAVLFGFTVLFVVALPIATLMSIMNNYLKLKFEAWKLFNMYQRPPPSSAQDIGTWQTIFTIISIIAVVTNAGLVCFTMDLLWERFMLSSRLWIFFGFQWVMILVQGFLTIAVPDVHPDVTMQIERMAFIQSKVVDKLPDEDFDAEFYAEQEEDALLGNNEGTPESGAANNKKKKGLFKGMCCQCVKQATRKTKGKNVKKIAANLKDFQIFSYPAERMDSSKWPEPLNKQTAQRFNDQAEAQGSYGDTVGTIAVMGGGGGGGGESASDVPPPPAPSGYAAVTESDVSYF